MKLRTQLILLFLVLAALPLTGIVVYSYWTSVRAFSRAVETDNRRLAEEMTERMAEVQGDVATRIDRFEHFFADPETAQNRNLIASLPEFLGETKELVEVIRTTPPTPPSAGTPPPGTAVPRAAPPPPPHFAARDLEGDVLRAQTRARLAEMDRQLSLLAERGINVRIVPPGASETTEPGSEPAAEPSSQDLSVEWTTEGQASAWAGSFALRALPERILTRVVRGMARDPEEVPFAISRGGELVFASETDRERLQGLPLAEALGPARTPEAKKALQGWIVATGPDGGGEGPRFGIARRVAEPLEEFRATAVRNLTIGMALVGLCILGMLPMSKRLTRSLDELALSAEKLAQGDLTAQVPVRSSSELGRLARAFNRMAGDLEENQRLLVAQQVERREQELAQRLLAARNERQTQELEEARRFQLSLLPRTLPKRDDLEVAVAMRTATEVGGDYYDFHHGADGVLTVAVGDATGHGAMAGTMVTVLKGLFTAQGGKLGVTDFLRDAAATVRSMELGRVMMALCLARFTERRLTIGSAGMPPVLIYRAARREVEEIAIEGMPLGGMARFQYRERSTSLAAGDAVLLMSDGFPELPDADEEPLGYPRAEAAFLGCADQPARQIIAALLDAAKSWNGDRPLPDDVTFVVLKMR